MPSAWSVVHHPRRCHKASCKPQYAMKFVRPHYQPAVHRLQRKSYPREWWVLGRVRVQLKNDDGSPCNPEIPNSELH
jgi:SRP19 protein